MLEPRTLGRQGRHPQCECKRLVETGRFESDLAPSQPTMVHFRGGRAAIDINSCEQLGRGPSRSLS